MTVCYSSPDQCTSELGKKIQYWRAERPDEWTMDEFIRDADALDAKVKELEEDAVKCKDYCVELSAAVNNLTKENSQLRERLEHIKELYQSMIEE